MTHEISVFNYNEQNRLAASIDEHREVIGTLALLQFGAADVGLRAVHHVTREAEVESAVSAKAGVVMAGLPRD